MIVNKCDFIKSIFGNPYNRIRASQLISKLPLLPYKIEKGRCGIFYDYNELINAIKEYKCRVGSKTYDIKERIINATRRNT